MLYSVISKTRLPRPLSYHWKKILVKNSSLKSPKENDTFHPIYKFPHIRLVAIICRAKLLQTGLAITSIPACGILSKLDLISNDVFYATTAVGVFACAMLFIMSEFTRRAVGIVYVNEKADKVQIAYLNFWGRRRCVTVPTDDVIPFADISENPADLFVKLRRYSSKDTLYISVKYGQILDRVAFEEIFGRIDGARR